jgi:hypothetical protein
VSDSYVLFQPESVEDEVGDAYVAQVPSVVREAFASGGALRGIPEGRLEVLLPHPVLGLGVVGFLEEELELEQLAIGEVKPEDVLEAASDEQRNVK